MPAEGQDGLANAILDMAERQSIRLMTFRKTVPPDALDPRVSVDVHYPHFELQEALRLIVYGHEVGHAAVQSSAKAKEGLGYHREGYATSLLRSTFDGYAKCKDYLYSEDCLADIYSFWFLQSNAIVSPGTFNLRLDVNLALGRFLYTLWFASCLQLIRMTFRKSIEHDFSGLPLRHSADLMTPRFEAHRIHWERARTFPPAFAKRFRINPEIRRDILNTYLRYIDEYVAPNVLMSFEELCEEINGALPSASRVHSRDEGALTVQQIHQRMRRIIAEQCPPAAAHVGFWYMEMGRRPSDSDQGSFTLQRNQSIPTPIIRKWRSHRGSILDIENYSPPFVIPGRERGLRK